MDDSKLALKHAIERYMNAAHEDRVADQKRNDAVSRSAAAETKLKEAERALVEAVKPGHLRPRYIRTPNGCNVLVVTEKGVTVAELHDD